MKIFQWASHSKVIWAVLFCVMALFFLSASTSFAAPENACGGYHYVQAGDTLYSISKQYGVSIPAIMRANPYLQSPDKIYAGTYLYIPCGSGGPGIGGPCSTVHIIAWGQTLGEIALYYHVPPYLIVQANGITNPNLIYAGQPLCIP